MPFQYLLHLLTVPVRVGDTDARFIFDTGIGVNMVSASLAGAVGCTPSGPAFTGRRMSGQEVTIPMGSLDSVRLGDSQSQDVPAGIFDMGAMAGLEGIDGFLSLQYFRSAPVTVDYPAQVIVLEDEQSLARRAESGIAVSVQAKHDGPATDVHLELRLPGGRVITAEVDAGSDQLILNEALAAEVGANLAGQAVRKVEGRDETGHTFACYFTTLQGGISLAAAPQISQANPDVQFQEIIYDGLLGDRFLRSFIVTYDLPRSRMIFTPPG
ncbi:MAG: retropepsin-like aspartic protease [Streptosporangiaceae bacterium]